MLDCIAVPVRLPSEVHGHQGERHQAENHPAAEQARGDS
jgi:hypothetical protein